MDYTVIYIIVFYVSSAIIGFLMTYIMKKYKIDSENIVISIESVLKDMKFGNDEEIEKVTNIMINTLDYIKTIPNEINKDDKIFQVAKYTADLCEQFNINLNEERKRIINVALVSIYNLINLIKNKED